ncbi:MAG: anhydro-N-acetylmuramic acid kinase [Pararhizobium sp.]
MPESHRSIRTAIGLMSGTSLDGIDVALLRTDGREVVERGPFLGVPYEAAFRRRLGEALETAKAVGARTERPGDLAETERLLTLRHAEAVRRFLERHGLEAGAIDVIGFHGQTVLHRPLQGLTVQLGDGDLLSRETGIPVVYDMRANDMRHGGEGAPLAPAYHRALAANVAAEVAAMPAVFVNIGGISNVTFIGRDGAVIAFDSGPGNTLIDQWVERHAGVPFDQGGAIASEGRVLTPLADRYLAADFFTAKHRRSLDRNDFRPPADDEAELADGARTLCHVTAAAILKAADHLPEQPKLWIVCGGGRLNRIVMEDMRAIAGPDARVVTAEEAGFDGDAMEAEAWAYLAVRALDGLPLSWPTTTGVRKPVSGGVIARPGNETAAGRGHG